VHFRNGQTGRGNAAIKKTKVDSSVRALFLVPIVLLVFLPRAQGEALPLESDEAVLTDPVGDVIYAPGYPGTRDHDYLDVEALWLQYLDESDEVVLLLQVHDATALATPVVERTTWCHLQVDVFVDGRKAGNLTYNVYTDVNGSIASSVRWTNHVSSGDFWRLEGENPELPHTFEARLARPGSFEFRLPRAALLLWGDSFNRVWINCGEWIDPTRRASVLFNNYDEASADTRFDLTQLTPESPPPGPEAPWEVPVGAVASGIGVVLLIRWIIGWWMYARIAPHEVLQNPSRAILVELLRANPGMHFRELMRKGQLAPGALSHHLQILERSGVVTKAEYHGFACYFLVGEDPKIVIANAVLRAPTARWILGEVKKRPGVTATILASERHVHGSSILHHVRRLVEAGLLARRRTRFGFELTAQAEQRTAYASSNDVAAGILE
jgi:DNA-binding MarR family transcriptional regulator